VIGKSVPTSVLAIKHWKYNLLAYDADLYSVFDNYNTT
jgi:hypothetical protein